MLLGRLPLCSGTAYVLTSPPQVCQDTPITSRKALAGARTYRMAGTYCAQPLVSESVWLVKNDPVEPALRSHDIKLAFVILTEARDILARVQRRPVEMLGDLTVHIAETPDKTCAKITIEVGTLKRGDG